MTLTDEIEKALAEPIDQEILAAASDAVSERVRPIQHRIKATKLVYTLLLKIKRLETKIEAERWRDADKEKPQHEVVVLCLGDGFAFVGTWNERLQVWQEGPTVRKVWKWKPFFIL